MFSVKYALNSKCTLDEYYCSESQTLQHFSFGWMIFWRIISECTKEWLIGNLISSSIMLCFIGEYYL